MDRETRRRRRARRKDAGENRRVRRRGLLDPERRLAHGLPVPGHQLQDACSFFEHVPGLIVPVLGREPFGRRARLVFQRDVGAEGYQTPDCRYTSTNGRPHEWSGALFRPTIDLRALLQDERDDVSISFSSGIVERRDAIM